MFTDYLFHMARLIRRVSDIPIYNLTKTVPLQIDFMIVNKDIIMNIGDALQCKGIQELFESDDDDDDVDVSSGQSDYKSCSIENKDENDPDAVPRMPADLDAFLKKKKMKYYSYDSTNRWQNAVEDMKKLHDNKRCKRNVFILDRRKKNLSHDRLYLFKSPTKENNSF